MADTEVPPEDECLHCKLIAVIEEHIEQRVGTGAEVNAADVTYKIAEALGQFIREAVPAEERAEMIAYALEHLGQTLRATDETDTRH